jgi:hypothetical protein
MLETVRNSICCKVCNCILNKPVILPCGETICAKHDYIYKNKHTCKCQLCEKERFLDESESFPQNKAIEGLLEADISKLNLGDDYKIAWEYLNALSYNQDKYEKLKSSPEEFIHEKFQAMRHKVDLVRERLIQKINDRSDKIIADIDSYEHECKMNLSSIKPCPKELDISTIKEELTVWQENLKKLFYDESLCSTVRNKGSENLTKIVEIHRELINEILLGQERKAEFETKHSNVLNVFHDCLDLNRYFTFWCCTHSKSFKHL